VDLSEPLVDRASVTSLGRKYHMLRAISYAKMLLVACVTAASLIGFAGTASAASDCWGKIPAGSAHQPFSHGPTSDEGCGDHDDTSKTSMADITAAGSWKDSNPAFAYSPQTKAHKAA
jgi:hypothetical protein